jgi:hypothetical protein
MRLADFICAGAQKAGTTWLYAQLREHPQVYMRTKELNFFYRDLPTTWYAEQFAGASAGQACGDISPNYAAFAGLAESIYQTCPEARVIHVLRNPVERAFSQWKMARHIGNIPAAMPFLEAFHGNLQKMRRRGEYAPILREYARHYPLGQRLAVFWYDDIRSRPAELLRDLMAFLGIDTNWRPNDVRSVVGQSPSPAILAAADAAEVAAYYAPFDRELCDLLRVKSLPWFTS